VNGVRELVRRFEDWGRGHNCTVLTSQIKTISQNLTEHWYISNRADLLAQKLVNQKYILTKRKNVDYDNLLELGLGQKKIIN